MTDLSYTDNVTSPRWQTIRRWAVRAAGALAVFTPIFFMVAALGTRFGLWSLKTGFGTMTREIGPLFLFASLIVGLVASLFALLVRPRRGLWVGVLAVAVGLGGLGYAKGVQTKVANLPFIHDVTTDTQDPPVFTDVVLAERAATKGVNTLDYDGKTAPKLQADGSRKPVLVSALQTQAYPEIRTLVLNEPVDVVFGRAEQVVRDLGWAIKSTDLQAGTIEATDTTFWYGFKDDVAIRLRPSKGGGTRVDARSISRIGGSDIGANAARVQRFLDAMSE